VSSNYFVVTDTVVILNPTAGIPEILRDWRERIEPIVRRCPIRVTSQPGDAEALARRAVEEGFGRIVAAGGDGTVNHVANGIAGSDAALGLLPIGTVNVFGWSIYRAPMKNILCSSPAWDSTLKSSRKPASR
jgi:diacylglycerol kinase family enzyme